MGVRTIMNAAVRLCSAQLLCACLTGCALAPGLGGVAGGLLYDGFRGIGKTTERAEMDRCFASTDKGVRVAEPVKMTIPTDEGLVTTFALAGWRPGFRGFGDRDVERFKTPIEGTFAITERSALLVPLPGTPGVRIPFDMVLGVNVERSHVIGEPSSVIVKSCFGRFDIFTFWQVEPRRLDPEATAAAAAKIREGVAGFRAAADSAAEVRQ
jgi:hypothetical protein